MTRKILSNILIIGALAILFFTYYPLWTIYFGDNLPNQLVLQGSYISIPKISAKAPIIENVDPWNETEYQAALKNGVAEAKGIPNFYFAHSSLPPWEETRVNTAFLKLGQLQNSDQILIVKNGRSFNYKVTGKVEIWPWETKFVTDSKADLILQTCTPPGTAFRRLLIYAQLT